MMTVEQICALMEEWAPTYTQCGFDHSGFQVGDRRAPVTRVLAALDATEAVLAECAQTGAQLLITHHPLLFTPLHEVSTETREGRLAMQAIRSGVAIYASHTPLDAAQGGVNDELCRLLGVQNTCGMAEQYVGEQGTLYSARLGTLPAEETLDDLCARTARILGAPCRAVGAGNQRLHKAAVCGGAGGDFVREAARCGADVLITGEMKHHQMLEAEAFGVCVVEAGHYATEAPVIAPVIQYLQKRIHVLQYPIQVMEAESQHHPFH